MILRAAKISLLCAVALFYTIVVFGNITDYNSNYQFVRHVLMMDSTFPGNRGMWRSLNSAGWQTVFYLGIIAWECLVTLLSWWGAVRLTRVFNASAPVFHRAKSVSIAGLALALLLWLVAFLDIGGEWFLMWQSKTWNGQEAAFRMFTVTGIVLLLLVQPESEEQP
jgi:predicted small integral membrane protein